MWVATLPRKDRKQELDINEERSGESNFGSHSPKRREEVTRGLNIDEEVSGERKFGSHSPERREKLLVG